MSRTQNISTKLKGTQEDLHSMNIKKQTQQFPMTRRSVTGESQNTVVASSFWLALLLSPVAECRVLLLADRKFACGLHELRKHRWYHSLTTCALQRQQHHRNGVCPQLLLTLEYRYACVYVFIYTRVQISCTCVYVTVCNCMYVTVCM